MNTASFEIGTLMLLPEDRVVIRFPENMSQREIDDTLTQIKEKLPVNTPIITLFGDTQISVIRPLAHE